MMMGAYSIRCVLNAYCFCIPGVMADIRTQKAAACSRKDDDTAGITDVSDGTAYRKMLSDDEFLTNADYNITAILNTDGVNLYSSSKVELWPIFMAINELNPKARFSRNNVLLVAIWQGKGKPPFKQYVESLAPHLNSLYRDGVDITINDDNINVKLKVVCGVFDLPAKAGILNMTYFNGQEACITCEEPGLTVKQGKGTARSYPDRNGQYTLRKHEEVLNCMQLATDKKRIKGLKGVSGLASIESFDLVDGIVPDYMHGVLLGITSTLMSKWFSPTESSKVYFIGKHLKEISVRLQNIQPPTSIERLPRDLEKNYKSLKATELQAWLLFYAVPCLAGILPERYLAHFSCFSEAVYILLGDQITPTRLQRAELLLDQFYSLFAELYGAGSCGLNVHNTCVHLVHYVKLWGPLWAWSCFGFEDNNAMLLQAVHGTGQVMKQIMWYKQVEATLRRKSVNEVRSKIWKTTHKAENCDVSGKMTVFENDGTENVLAKLGVDSVENVKQIARISVNGHQFCSLRYTRMKKRACSYVLYEDSKVGCVKYFVINTGSGTVYAVLEKYDTCEEVQISELPAGKHLVPVKGTGTVDVILADSLIDTLVYIKVCPEISSCIALMPSTHGHAIFK